MDLGDLRKTNSKEGMEAEAATGSGPSPPDALASRATPDRGPAQIGLEKALDFARKAGITSQIS
jgi:hypothetical protein